MATLVIYRRTLLLHVSPRAFAAFLKLVKVHFRKPSARAYFAPADIDVPQVAVIAKTLHLLRGNVQHCGDFGLRKPLLCAHFTNTPQLFALLGITR